MDRAEVLDRVRQASSKRVDVTLARLGYHFTAGSAAGVKPAFGTFFFDPGSVGRLLTLLRERLPEHAEEIVARARAYCTHRFDLLGYGGVDYGEAIDWHADKVHGNIAPRVPFHRVPYFEYASVGDPKVTWELNRHQHFICLAKAFRLTADAAFAAEIVSQWESWQSANPYPVGINWASSLEVAFRALSWLWTLFLLEGTAAMTPRLRSSILQALALSARHIERYLSTYSSPNTHLLGEGVALFFIGTLCPSIPAAQRWRDAGWSIVLAQAQRQVRPDGVHFEHSTYYHVYALDFLLHATILAERNGIAVPAALRTTVRKMLDVLCAFAPSGVPRLGDDDGGRVFDGRRNRSEHLTDPLSTGAILFERADFKSAARHIREETLWLLGESGLVTWDRLGSAPFVARSLAFAESGLYFIGGSDVSMQAIVDAGIPESSAAGHWHAACLNVCLSEHGKPLLIDPGACAYVDAAGKRSAFRATSAHNTVQIAGHSQAGADGPFGWASLPGVKVDTWVRAAHFDLFAAAHTGYERVRDGLVHRRHIFLLHSQFLFVRDVVFGSGEEQLDQHWHLAPDLVRAQDDALIFARSDGDGVAFAPALEDDWQQSVSSASWSPAYGREESAPVVRFSGKVALPAEFAVVVSPTHCSSVPGTLTRVAADPAASVSAYSYRNAFNEFLLCFAQPRTRWSVGTCTSDAEFLCVHRTGDVPALTALYNGTFARIAGNEVKA